MKISKSSFLFAFESKSFGEPNLFFIREKNLLLGCIPLAVDDGQAFQLIAKDAEASLGFFQCLETQCIFKFCFFVLRLNGIASASFWMVA